MDDDSWLRGDANERFHTVAEHLRGFGPAMIEVGYRYVELYWAGHDENWGYAEHQLEEMVEVVDLALERRPERRESSEMFFYNSVRAMEEAVAARDRGMFMERFERFTTNCNACHVSEGVPFFRVAQPTFRLSPITTAAE